MNSEKLLADMLQDLRREEERRLSPLACLSGAAVRRRLEERRDHRQPFARDCDRILHSRAYSRYVDKTQVFSLVENDHISHRALHVQIVSRVARTIGRFLALNEDLIEAIALGHDIGHPPFGHEGERILDTLCREHGLPGFAHNVQSVRFLDRIERGGRGWNLTLQVLDGILCHDGEADTTRLEPVRSKDFSVLDSQLHAWQEKQAMAQLPMTLEGCVVRLADTIAYIGRDIEDAIELGLVNREEIPPRCAKGLGRTNGTIVYHLVTDLIVHSRHVRSGETGQDWIGFSDRTAELLLELKRFNYRRIYHNPAFKPDFDMIHECYRALFDHFMDQAKKERGVMATGEDRGHGDEPAAKVRDYLAGMTDDYFLDQARKLGCPVPERTCMPN